METIRTVVLPLDPSLPVALEATLQEVKRAYGIISQAAFEGQARSAHEIHRMVYARVRSSTRLTAQMTCSAIRTVAAAYKSASSNRQRLGSAVNFSGRCIDLQGGARGRDFRLYPERRTVSLSTVDGRITIPYRCGDFQIRYLEDPSWRVRSARLLHKRRAKGWRYELHVSLLKRVEQHPPSEGRGVLGVDTGRRYLAAVTTGDDAHFFKSGHLKPKKEHLRRLRGRLKSQGTRSSTRAYGRVSGRETRLTKDFQHCTAKAIVTIALEKGCSAIAVERLNGIRRRTGAKGGKARYHHATWAYARFLDMLRYKAAGAGVEVVEVDPENTSRRCSKCGHVAGENRSGLSFVCTQCGYSLHADLNAARNIRLRAISDGQVLARDGSTLSCGPEAELYEAETSSPEDEPRPRATANRLL